MNTSSLLLAGLAFVVLLWAGLSVWRDVALQRWHNIERSYVAYYASRQSEAPGAVPPVRWDFETERLVQIPPEEYAAAEGQPSPPGRPNMSSVLTQSLAGPLHSGRGGLHSGRSPACGFMERSQR